MSHCSLDDMLDQKQKAVELFFTKGSNKDRDFLKYPNIFCFCKSQNAKQLYYHSVSKQALKHVEYFHKNIDGFATIFN